LNARESLQYLRRHESQLLFVHYSCQSLGDGNEGLSPRITSIAVLHFESASMHSFSIHLVAEAKGVGRDEIPSRYNELEGEMLQQFYTFVLGHQECPWLHWNMSNINYGFEAIAHRYRVLNHGDAPTIQDSKRFNLSVLVSSVYGQHYVDDPKMLKLMECNGGRHRDFMTGAEEAAAFENKQYVGLHKSTMCKVYFFKSTYSLLQARKLKTAHTNFWNRANEFMEKPFAKLLGFITVLFSLYQLGQAIYAAIPHSL